MARQEWVERQPDETEEAFAERRLRFIGLLPGETDMEYQQRCQARHMAYVQKLQQSLQDVETRLQAVEQTMHAVDYDGLYRQHLDLRVQKGTVQQQLDRAMRSSWNPVVPTV